MQPTLILVYQKINDAKRQLLDELDLPGAELYSESEAKDIRQGVRLLDHLASDILVLDLKTQADQIQQQVNDLRVLTQRITETTEKLARVAEVLTDISDKITALLSVVTILSGAGLL